MTDTNEFLFVEKYRPRTVAECVLPARIKRIFQEYVNKKQIPNMMLSGGPGVGKTTAAIAMCEEIGLNYMMINASRERGIDTLRVKVVNYASTLSLTGGHKVIIMDEADSLTPETQLALRGTIEEFSSNCTFIITCNFKSKLLDALHSRMPNVDFNLTADEKPHMAAAFFKRLQEILQAENITFTKDALIKIIQLYFPDYRRILGELQRLGSGGVIDETILAQVSDVRNIKELAGFLKDKNFGEVRKWVVENGDVDASRIFRKIYDALYEYMQAASIPMAVIIISKYQYQSAFVADPEINILAMLTEIMIECDFK
jgi:DNA polymerase III delta prime subunit